MKLKISQDMHKSYVCHQLWFFTWPSTGSMGFKPVLSIPGRWVGLLDSLVLVEELRDECSYQNIIDCKSVLFSDRCLLHWSLLEKRKVIRKQVIGRKWMKDWETNKSWKTLIFSLTMKKLFFSYYLLYGFTLYKNMANL